MKEIQLHRIDLNLLVVFEALMVEGSVIAAADKLGKTPSAVSHALARLRMQLGDPLLVKVGGRMQPSPFALTLIDEVRQILRSIKRVLALPQPFDPASSDRVFRIACPLSCKLLAQVLNELHEAAPGIRLEWLTAPRQVYAAVAEGLVDLAHLGGETRLPDGLSEVEAPALTSTSFVRAGHPAISDWGPEAWLRHRHVQVNIANNVLNPVDTPPVNAHRERFVGALISEFSSLGPLLANSDLIGTFPRMLLAWDMERYGLQPLAPPIPLPPFRARFFWSSRLDGDPANQWIRGIVLRIYRNLHQEADRLVEDALVHGR
jgi:DNA-binding transcriptional LysR family regulator